ncbi:tyrosine-type recombinase/integrase [Bellilinea sp.]|uniref:tyrosine-type recombinase/integrase n=1 Tax=Bellilinea sp. TaxID=2838785 RepID=UPI002ADDFEFC|nr:tyrosine-type recombinase/integrase [Bellilinea sp.]
MSPHHTIRIEEAFDEFLLSRQAMRCSPRTIRTYRSILGRFIQWLKKEGVQSVIQLSPRHVRKFMSQTSGSQWTLNGYGRAIRTFLNFLVQEELVDHKISIKVPPPPKQRLPFLNSSQIKQLLEFCDPQEKAIILLIVDSGLRRQEVCNLKIGNVQIESGMIRVVQGKGNKDRIVFIGRSTINALLDYLPDFNCRERESPLFKSSNGKPFNEDTMRRMFQRLSKRSGIKVTPHMLRRSFATLSLKLGMDLVSLQMLMGHASIETTRKYIQLLDDDLQNAHRKAGPVDRLNLNITSFASD